MERSDTIFALKRELVSGRNLASNRIEKLNSKAKLVGRLNRANAATTVCLLARSILHARYYLDLDEREREVNINLDCNRSRIRLTSSKWLFRPRREISLIKSR